MSASSRLHRCADCIDSHVLTDPDHRKNERHVGVYWLRGSRPRRLHRLSRAFHPQSLPERKACRSLCFYGNDEGTGDIKSLPLIGCRPRGYIRAKNFPNVKNFRPHRLSRALHSRSLPERKARRSHVGFEDHTPTRQKCFMWRV